MYDVKIYKIQVTAQPFMCHYDLLIKLDAHKVGHEQTYILLFNTTADALLDTYAYFVATHIRLLCSTKYCYIHVLDSGM